MSQLIDRESLMWRFTPDLLGVLSVDGVFLQTNPAWQKTLGWTQSEIASKEFFYFMHPQDIPASAAAFAEIKTGQPVLNFVNRYRHKDGGYRWLSWNAAPDENAFFCSARDVTEAKENEAYIKDQKIEAELREQLIAILSHDLRNPLAAVNSVLRLISKQRDDAKKAELTEAAFDSISRMSKLIDQTMDFTRARLGSDLGFEFEEVADLDQRLKHVVQEIGLSHPQADIKETYGDLGSCYCDPHRICQLLSNLVSNAVFHGDDGKPIFVEVATRADVLELRVKNSASRIPESVQNNIFEPFERSSYSQSQNGLGLGLFICKEIADGHGGTLRVQSGEKFTSFTLKIPRTKS